MALPADFADWLDYAAAVALLVFTWNEGPFVMALFVLALTLPYVAVGPFLAIVVDRMPLRTVLVASNAGRAVATLGMVFAGETIALLILIFLRASVDSAFTPARQAAIQATSPKALLQTANGLHQGINQLSKIVGPALGGLLLVALSPHALFAVNAALSVVAAMIAATILIDHKAEETADTGAHFMTKALAGFNEFRKNRLLRLALVFVAAGFFAVFLYDALIAILTEEFGFDETVFGLSMAAAGAGGLIGALVAGRITRIAPLTLMAVAVICGGVPTVVLGIAGLTGWSPALPVFLVAIAIMGGSVGFTTVPYRTILQSEAPPERMARVAAAGEAITVTVMMTAPFIGSAIATALGTGSAFVVGGLIMLTLGGLTLLRRRR